MRSQHDAPPPPGKASPDGLGSLLTEQINAEIALTVREMKLAGIRYVDKSVVLEIARRFRDDVRTTVTDKGKKHD